MTKPNPPDWPYGAGRIDLIDYGEKAAEGARASANDYETPPADPPIIGHGTPLLPSPQPKFSSWRAKELLMEEAERREAEALEARTLCGMDGPRDSGAATKTLQQDQFRNQYQLCSACADIKCSGPNVCWCSCHYPPRRNAFPGLPNTPPTTAPDLGKIDTQSKEKPPDSCDDCWNPQFQCPRPELCLCDCHEKDSMSADEDVVNRPPWYTHGSIETLAGIKGLGLCDEHYLASAVKYISRCRWKGQPVKDLKQAIWYLQRWIDEREEDERTN